MFASALKIASLWLKSERLFPNPERIVVRLRLCDGQQYSRGTTRVAGSALGKTVSPKCFLILLERGEL